MKKIFSFQYIIFAVILLGFMSCDKEDQKDLPDYESHTLRSNFTNTDYTIQVLYPDNYKASEAYPTVFMFDADWYAEEMRTIFHEKYATQCVLVAVGYKGKIKRERDFTYPQDDIMRGSGGGKEYIQFINNELLPYVKNELNIISTEKTFLGHSLGAYLGIYLLLQQEFPNPFENIIAVSPSLFWHDAYIFEMENSYANAHNDLNVNLYMSVGDLEGVTMNTHFDAFVNKMQSRSYNGLSLFTERLKNRSHQNTPILGFDNGLTYILKN